MHRRAEWVLGTAPRAGPLGVANLGTVSSPEKKGAFKEVRPEIAIGTIHLYPMIWVQGYRLHIVPRPRGFPVLPPYRLEELTDLKQHLPHTKSTYYLSTIAATARTAQLVRHAIRTEVQYIRVHSYGMNSVILLLPAISNYTTQYQESMPCISLKSHR